MKPINPLTLDALNKALLPDLPAEEFELHLMAVITVCLYRLNDMHGNEFMQGFLERAIDSFNAGDKLPYWDLFFGGNDAAH